jgi:NitT/TauT family transport system ATP-binding protein
MAILPPLPDAYLGRLMGLLEAMSRTPGPDRVSRLAAALHLGLDGLLPLLAAAQLLGWAAGAKGRYDLTDAGRRVVEADQAGRKVLFRERARDVPLLRLILEALAASGGRPVPRETILSALVGHFPEPEARRQFDTAVNWGRYAEMFDYDAETGSLTPQAP